MSGENENASLPQLQEMAEEIAEAACDHSPDFPRFGGADFKAHVAERLAPLYAELERLRAEVAGHVKAQEVVSLAIVRAHATIDRMMKLLVECRGYVQNVDIGYLQPIVTDLLTRLDAETGGK